MVIFRAHEVATARANAAIFMMPATYRMLGTILDRINARADIDNDPEMYWNELTWTMPSTKRNQRLAAFVKSYGHRLPTD